MYNTVDFINQYIKLEEWANNKYGEGCLKEFEDSPFDYKTRNELFYFRKVRNLVAHSRNRNNKSQDAFIKLTDAFKARFDRTCRNLMDSIQSVCVPYEDIYKCIMRDKVLPTISVMREKVYTNVPIMKGKSVWGVFSESTIFEVVGDGKMAPFNEKTEFFEIRKYIIDYSRNGIYDFASCEDSIDYVCKMFSDATRHGRRLDVIFITSNGNKDGDLVGLITVWDIAKL